MGWGVSIPQSYCYEFNAPRAAVSNDAIWTDYYCAEAEFWLAKAKADR